MAGEYEPESTSARLAAADAARRALRAAQEQAEWEHKQPATATGFMVGVGATPPKQRLYTRDEVLFVAGAAMGGSAESALNALRYLDTGK